MSADGPRDCRCPPSRRRRAAAARSDLRVVPVVEVASVPFERSIVKSAFVVRSMSCAGRNVAEIVGGQVREQRQSHIGRRRAMRDDGDRMLLIVIRRQPMIVRADESLEECPGLARQSSEGRWSGRAVSAASRRAERRLIHQAIDGEANQRHRMGAATPARPVDEPRQSRSPTAHASAGAIHMDLDSSATQVAVAARDRARSTDSTQQR